MTIYSCWRFLKQKAEESVPDVCRLCFSRLFDRLMIDISIGVFRLVHDDQRRSKLISRSWCFFDLAFFALGGIGAEIAAVSRVLDAEARRVFFINWAGFATIHRLASDALGSGN